MNYWKLKPVSGSINHLIQKHIQEKTAQLLSFLYFCISNLNFLYASVYFSR